jgi:hypothetical protein
MRKCSSSRHHRTRSTRCRPFGRGHCSTQTIALVPVCSLVAQPAVSRPTHQPLPRTQQPAAAATARHPAAALAQQRASDLVPSHALETPPTGTLPQAAGSLNAAAAAAVTWPCRLGLWVSLRFRQHPVQGLFGPQLDLLAVLLQDLSRVLDPHCSICWGQCRGSYHPWARYSPCQWDSQLLQHRARWHLGSRQMQQQQA